MPSLSYLASLLSAPAIGGGAVDAQEELLSGQSGVRVAVETHDLGHAAGAGPVQVAVVAVALGGCE